MLVDQYNTTQNIPLVVLANSGDFAGVGGANPTVQLSKNGADWSDAQGEILDIGDGGYWLKADPRDADTVGAVLMRVVAPTGDIAPMQGFCVKAPSIFQQILSLPSALAKIARNSDINTNNLRLLTGSQVSAQQKGQIQ